MSVTAVPIPPVKTSYKVWIWLGVIAAVAAGVLLAWAGTRDRNAEFLASNARNPGVMTTASGLQYQVLEKGNGPKPTSNDVALVNYEGRFTDGKVFDKSEQPTPMPVSAVVPGFTEALKLMPKGSKFRVWIPPHLGYGDKDKKAPDGSIAIPANSILVFEVQLLDFIPEQQYRQIMMQQQMMQMQQGGGMPGQMPGGQPPVER